MKKLIKFDEKLINEIKNYDDSIHGVWTDQTFKQYLNIGEALMKQVKLEFLIGVYGRKMMGHFCYDNDFYNLL